MKRLLSFLLLSLLMFGCECTIDADLRQPRTEVQKARVDHPPPNEYPPPVVWVSAKNVSNDTLSVVYYRADFQSQKTHRKWWTRLIRCDFPVLAPGETNGLTRCTFIDDRPDPNDRGNQDTLVLRETVIE